MWPMRITTALAGAVRNVPCKKMRAVLLTNDPVALSFAQAMLAGEGVPSVVLDTEMSVLDGSIGAIPRRLAVASDMAARARSLLRDAGVEPYEGG